MTVSDHPTVQESAVVGRLAGLREGLATAVRQSRVLGPLVERLGRLWRARVTDDASAGRGALANSRLAGGVQRPTAGIGDATRRSRAAGLTTSAQQFVEHSWLYRWLTAEPEPDVIVIDLRETVTVGPWLRAIQRALEWLLPAAVSSTLFRTCRRVHRIATVRPVQLASIFLAVVAVLVIAVAARVGDPSPVLVGTGILLALLALAGSRVTWTYEELRETRGYQLLADAFEPPEPPEPVHRHEDDSEDAVSGVDEDTESTR